MIWWQCSFLGACGGSVVEMVLAFASVRDWQRARRTPKGLVKQKPPRLRVYVDLPAHLCALPFRAFLGAVPAGTLGWGGQISGPWVALILGLGAPALLLRLGSNPQLSAAVAGIPTTGGSPTQIARAVSLPTDDEFSDLEGMSVKAGPGLTGGAE
ncbi:hypothetical protein [Kitasatospora sp. NPDC059599]|uniref:hypothetical protein n=1 Tax=Kitasatospora sp. NPDC059599 TaxID=3346880 RepID=UPI003687304F